MAYRVELLEGAQREYRAIVDYLAKVAHAPQAAKTFVDELDHQVALIVDNPLMCELSRVPALSARGYRVCLVGNYAMLYTVREECIFIAHIFHQSQDYARLI